MHPCYLALGRRAAKTVSVCYHKYAHYECCATVGHEPIMFTSPPPLSLSLSRPSCMTPLVSSNRCWCPELFMNDLVPVQLYIHVPGRMYSDSDSQMALAVIFSHAAFRQCDSHVCLPVSLVTVSLCLCRLSVSPHTHTHTLSLSL